MTTNKTIFLGALLVGVGVGAYSYRKGIQRLVFSLDGFETAPDGVNLIVRIRVVNPNRFFAYPVPKLIVNAFDDTGSFIGTILNQQFQTIPANATSFIYGLVQPSWQNLVNLIVSVINTQQIPTGIVFHGEIEVGPVKIPFDTTQQIPGVNGVYSPEEIEEAMLMMPVV